MKTKYLLLFGLLLFVACVVLWPMEKVKSKPFHSAHELDIFRQHMRDPIDSGQFFLTAANCKGCHGHDPDGLANIGADGADVNVFEDWETSMMGLSAIDPFWRAKISHESLTNPAHADALQTVCTSCHAPMGNYTAKFHGEQHYTLANVLQDSLGLNGVGCGGCHSISDVGLGGMFSGSIPYDTTHKLFGPFPGPMAGPMELYVGMTPTYSTHVSQGNFCSPCHTLITKTVDLDGNYTGGTFVEQATYHEWLNSDFPSLNITCQTCHMPPLEEAVIIANGYAALQGRSPFNQHEFAGGNAFMINLIKQNKVKLGVTSTDEQFDSTLAATYRLLQTKTLDLTVTKDTVANDTAYFSVKLKNKTGHKFPSGYPSRRAVLQFVVTDDTGDTLFASGMFDDSYRVIGEPDSFAPHKNKVTNPAHSQIYEMVMADVTGNRTTGLERSASFLKDNRIPPAGFTTAHTSYDTIKIVGAENDPDFNKNGATQGTGIDIVHFNVGLNGFTGHINVSASVYYQSVPPKWLEEMFLLNSPEIDSFRVMYNDSDPTPILIANDTLQNVAIWTGSTTVTKAPHISVNPNPSFDGNVVVSLGQHVATSKIEVVDNAGQVLKISYKQTGDKIELTLPSQPGVYYLRVTSGALVRSFKLLRL